MTATEELRRMLDKRGVEWMDDSYAQLWCTVWHGQDGKQWRMTENRSGMLTELKAWQVTPEQAIDATLGRRTTTRHGKFRTKYGRSVPCCECCGYGIGDMRWHYCPSCGAEVVSE